MLRSTQQNIADAIALTRIIDPYDPAVRARIATSGHPVAEDPPPEERTVKVAELIKEREAKQEAQRERDDIKKRLDELEAKDATEVERLTKRVTELEADNQKVTAERDKLHKDGERQNKKQLIADAARSANFHNPSAAASQLSDDVFDGVTDQDSADKAVKALAEREGWMVKASEPSREGPEKILKDGKLVDPEDKPDDKDIIPAEELNAMSVDETREAMKADPQRYERSLAAADKA